MYFDSKKGKIDDSEIESRCSEIIEMLYCEHKNYEILKATIENFCNFLQFRDESTFMCKFDDKKLLQEAIENHDSWAIRIYLYTQKYYEKYGKIFKTKNVKLRIKNDN